MLTLGGGPEPEEGGKEGGGGGRLDVATLRDGRMLDVVPALRYHPGADFDTRSFGFKKLSKLWIYCSLA